MCFFLNVCVLVKKTWQMFFHANGNYLRISMQVQSAKENEKKVFHQPFFFHLHLVGFFIVTITNSSSQSNTTTTTTKSSSWHFNLQQCSKHCSLVVPTALRPGPYYIISVFMRVIHITFVCFSSTFLDTLFALYPSFSHIANKHMVCVNLCSLALFCVWKNKRKFRKIWKILKKRNVIKSSWIKS